MGFFKRHLHPESPRSPALQGGEGAVHVYARGDTLGTDWHRLSNPIRAAHPATPIRNIELPRGVSHVGLSSTHPERTDARMWREVVQGFLRRIEALRSDGPPAH